LNQPAVIQADASSQVRVCCSMVNQ